MAFVTLTNSEPPRTAQDRPANAIVATCAGAGAGDKTMADPKSMTYAEFFGARKPHSNVWLIVGMPYDTDSGEWYIDGQWTKDAPRG